MRIRCGECPHGSRALRGIQTPRGVRGGARGLRGAEDRPVHPTGSASGREREADEQEEKRGEAEEEGEGTEIARGFGGR